MALSILYIGSLNPQSNSFGRFKSLDLMGYEMRGINADDFIYKGAFIKFHHHLNIGPGINSINKKVVSVAKECKPDIVWVDNKSWLNAHTLKTIKTNYPAAKIVNIVTDDITGKSKSQWRLALRNVKYFDWIFVQRSVNIDELKRYGARNVGLCYRSYDPAFHIPLKLNAEEIAKYKCTVGFVGTYEREREEYVAFLIQNNIPVSITGDSWPGGKYWQLIKPYYKGSSVYGEDYIKTINGMDIALHFLRRGNRDEQDSRTFEIPSCGVFMLAEKSAVHLSLFNDGKEAVYFTAKEELL
ncbi:MAG: glycosyltransferase, partial [Ferruginibacter sp.]